MRARTAAALGAVAGLPAATALVSMVVSRRGAGFSMVGAVPFGEVLLLVPAAASTATAVLLLLRRPGRWRPAALLSAAGTAWLLTEWDNPDAGSVVFSIGLACFCVAPVVLVHAALAYPSGRLPDRPAVALLGLGYAVTAGLQGVVSALWFSPAATGCRECPRNLWLVASDPTRMALADRWGVRLGLIWAVTAALVLLVGLLRSSRAARRATGGVHVAGLVCAAVAVTSYAYSLERGFLGSDDVDRQLWVGQAIALMLLAVAVLADLVRDRRAQRALARMVVDLSSVSGPVGSLREALARRLSDPDLVLAYPVDGGFVDAAAHPVLVSPADGRVVTELRYAGECLAVLVHRSGALVGGDAVDDLTAAIHLGLEHERLRSEALAQVEDLRASGLRLVGAGDQERRRLERDLHDGAQQRLVGLALGLRLLAARQGGSPLLAEAGRELDVAIDDVRSIARGLTPLVLTDSGLVAAVRALAEGRELRVREVPAGRFAPVLEATAYFAVDRASAASPALVAITTGDGALDVRVEVDGPAPALGDLADRVTTLGGELAVSPTKGGCLVSLRLPADGRPEPPGPQRCRQV